MDKKQWYEGLIGKDTIKDVARKAGISATTAWRQYSDGELNFSAENVILIARAYGSSPVKALVAFGYLSTEEGTLEIGIEEALSKATWPQIMQEMARRVEANPQNPTWSSPMEVEQ
ncbi:helix-turn-helix transcriptional regulator [Bifidobacterium sp. 82T10]|uniref:Helix-turn-helix transcriptional regulator n=1 Tax=Bifidobacterium miconis TaxID=2834435 RepID=A0ABS6WH40_9BIFI|nr:helix-turn-helix transcriptional regulator [Bifidobacterium miconis]MBW3093371.1 helix-turn-helix transcriptional regulator [Bifidobacterium miconis]